MQIVELADGGVAGLQHLDVQLGRDRLELLGRDREREAIHQVAPGPEAVGTACSGGAELGQPGERALEGVRVQVRHAGHDRARGVAARRGGRRAGAYLGQHAALVPDELDIAGPAARQQRVGGKQR